MTIGNFLYKLIISPIEAVLEILFGVIFSFVFSNGASIIFLSVIVNLMILPLYQRADVLQREATETEKKISKWKSHIANNFKGDEKMLMTSTYYKEVGYTPMKQVAGMLPLMIQIPFFIAAYHFLSNYNFQKLNGEAFGIIGHLDRPDGILALGQLTINVLPILMTVINIIASAIYTKEAPLKSKIQLYVMAFLFMVLLYNSPAGLVIYWTMNNAFSLVKNICMDPKGKKWVKILTFYISFNALLIYAISVRYYGTKEKIFMAGCMVFTAALIAAFLWLKKIITKRSKAHQNETAIVEKNDVMHWSGMAVLTILLGLLIPSAVISASTQEFILINAPVNPAVYVFHALILAAGTFLIWYSVYYYLMREKKSDVINKVTAVVILVGMTDYFFFGTKYGFMSHRFKYDYMPVITIKEMIINLLIIIALSAVLLFLLRTDRVRKMISFVYIVLIISMLALTISNIRKINKEYSDFETYNAQMDEGYDKRIIPMSKEGKNVMMIMLDKAIAYYIPYIFAEKPELLDQYAGFTCYTNALSLGRCTIFGSPGLYGGYEYTPYYANKREDMTMADKHDEALKMVPKLFADNGWTVRVLDPPYAGYEEISDLTIFNDLTLSGDVKAYLTGKFFYNEEDLKMERYIKENDLYRYSLFRCAPLVLQLHIYGNGNYRDPVNEVRKAQETDDSGGDGLTLKYLHDMVDIDEGCSYNYISMDNEFTHGPKLMSKPDYMTFISDFSPITRYDAEGRELLFDDPYQEACYDVDMHAFIQLGKFFDYLRENDLYDNTRIIIVSDHGNLQEQFADIKIEEGEAVFMVKDFDSKEFSYSTEFMTNADTPAISVAGLIDDPVNPYTGNKLDSHEKEGGVIFLYSHMWSPSMQTGYTLNLEPEDKWYRVHDNLYDLDNWEVYTE